MKKHITREQLNELDNESMVKLINSAYKKNHSYESIERGSAGLTIEGEEYYTGDIADFRVNIGNMIEIISNRLTAITPIKSKEPGKVFYAVYIDNGMKDFDSDELVDALWEACKFILED